MKLLPQLINDAPIVINPNRELTIVLRDKQISEIENLHITHDKFRCIDLTNNNLIKLGNLPKLENLETLLLGNNNITYIEANTLSKENGISSLSLYNNNLYKFQPEIRHIFPNLKNLVLIGNPVTEMENYRLFVVWLFPKLKVLDFKKVKQIERSKAEEIFGLDNLLLNENGSKMVKLNLNEGHQMDKNEKQLNNIVRKLTEDEKNDLLRKLETATSLDEIEQIEAALQKGISN